MRYLIYLTLLVVGTSCGKGDSGDSASKSEATPAPGMSKSEGASAAANKPGPSAAKTAGPSAAEVCKNVFPLEKVAEIIGKGELTHGLPPQVGGAGVECSYLSKVPEGTPPTAMAALTIDCRKVRATRAAMKGAFGKNEGFEESELGLYFKQVGSDQFIAFSKAPACTLTVTTGLFDERKADALAKFAAGNVTDKTAPR